jgi:hypothetical protein
VIPIAQTIVHKVAVVVELLHTPVAKVAMSRVLRPQILTVHAYIIQVKLFVK